QAHWFHRRVDQQIAWRVKGLIRGLLPVWHVHLWFDRRFDAHLSDVGDDADNRNPRRFRWRPTEIEAFADGVLTRPEVARHRLIDNGDRHGLFVVTPVE